MRNYNSSFKILTAGFLFFFLQLSNVSAQVPAAINSGNPNFPFPQFLGYTGGTQTLAHQNPVGVTHAEMEQRIREAYSIVCNNMTYNVGAAFAPLTVAGVKYIAPNHTPTNDIGHCQCVEGDGYYLLAAAYMADKTTFDGLYMYIHDREFHKTKRFVDCIVNSPGYDGNPGLAGSGYAFAGDWTKTSVNGGGAYYAPGGAALDGNEDVALALLMAWKQWGDLAKICDDPCTGLPVTYKSEAIRFIKAMVEPVSDGFGKHMPGVIGLDGYRKDGDVTWEITNWATAGYGGYIPSRPGPANCGSACAGGYNTYADYAASGYYKSFGDMLQAEGQPAFLVNQYRRGETSDDWIMGQAYAQGLIPWSGVLKVNEAGAGTTVNFKNFVDGEDFRYGWRTILNHMWNGTPTITWDPATHNYINAPNNFERDMALRFATFLKSPHAYSATNTPEVMEGLDYGGTPLLLAQYNTNGTKAVHPSPPARYYPINWAQGTGAPAAVVSQDFDLMAQMFRECVIKWDPSTRDAALGQQYINAQPGYFHEWFRLLGMLILTGNNHDPLDVDVLKDQANMKVYKATDKTYAFAGDTISYTISYRNYSKTTANNVVITDNLPAGLNFISASNGGTAAGSTVTWNLPNVPGFVTGGLAATMGSVTLKVKVSSAASGRICNTATISCSNGSGWTSNEYPNNITDVMERNCVDIVTDNPLTISKKGSRPTVMVGDTLSYTIVVKNKPVAFLNGGRPGVKITSAHSGLSAGQSILSLKYRVFHAAHEPVINYKNYRVSYFIKKAGPPTWTYDLIYNQGCTPAPTMSSQTMASFGATWNQRLILTFPNQLAVPYLHLEWYNNQSKYLHQGALAPQRVAYDIHTTPSNAFDWTAAADWSAEAAGTWAGVAVSPYYPIGNDWTDPLNPNQVVTTHHSNYVGSASYPALTRQLVEEWDGYTWRRAYGNAPVSGRELNNIVVKDTLPSEVTFVNYFTGYPTGSISGNVITWPTVSTLAIGDSIVYKFWVTVKDATYFNCPAGPTPATFTNRSSAKADHEPMALASATTNASCTAVPVLSPSMTKTADKGTYNSGEAIIYTIKYKNLSGTIVQGNTVQADWIIKEGGASIVLNSPTQINLVSPAWATRSWTYRYSHGTNGYIKGTYTLPRDRTYTVIVRDNGTTWTELRFRPQTAGNIQVEVYNMSANTLLAGGSQIFPFTTAASTSFDFQIQLSNGTINVWLAVPNAVLSASPTLTFTGATVQAGYAGVKTTLGDAGSTLTNWYTYLDSDFQLQMTDPIPSQVTFVSATNATYNAVPYTGSNVAGTVTWATIPGPILANDEITYVWNGTVNTCANITNTAVAKVRGISPDPAGQVIVGCNAPTPVTLISFTGHVVENDVELNWSTSMEHNNSHFIIERSYNGTDFNPIGEVPGNGNSTTVINYQFTDYRVGDGIIYYRLIQVDLDNTRAYSHIINVKLSSEKKIIIQPNPFSHETNMVVISDKQDQVSVRIKTVTGTVVYASDNYFTNENILLGAELSDAVYILQVISDNEIFTYKLVKNK